MPKLTTKLADLACNLTLEDAPDRTLLGLQLSLLDWIAVARAGADEPASQVIRRFAQSEGGAQQAQVFGLNTPVPARMAALANGTISHALDYDDTHFLHIGHPSVAIFPAALAMAQAQATTGRAFLEAALAGYEASCRVGDWLGRSHYEAGFHQTATAGAFGATLAAGRLLNLTPMQMRNAIGLVSTRASGLKSQFGTMGKPFNAGLAASNGIEAAQLTQLGFQANENGLETAQGFGPTHAATMNANWGEGFVSDQVQYKFHACCHGLHAMLEALESLKPDLGDADQIQQITIQTHPRWLKVCNIAEPQTGLETKFSYRLSAAMAVTGVDTGTLHSYSDEITRQSDLVSLRDRVLVETDDCLSDAQAVVTIVQRDGKILTARHDLEDRMSSNDLQTRVMRKAHSLMGQDLAAEIWSAITELPEQDSTSNLTELAFADLGA